MVGGHRVAILVMLVKESLLQKYTEKTFASEKSHMQMSLNKKEKWCVIEQKKKWRVTVKIIGTFSVYIPSIFESY